jgi:cytochrome c-type biogenesis protein CcmH
VVVPLAGVGLYLIHGQPEMPAQPLSARLDAAREQTGQADAEALIAQLRAKLATIDPNSPMGREGYILLGNSEDSLGHLAEAAEAWKVALRAKFDPTLAAQTAEAQSRLDGKVTPETAALFKQALAAAPPDAPWRTLAQNRLATAPQ